MIRITLKNDKKLLQRGDTLVEVMLAISVLSMVVVGCMNIMNKSNLQMIDSVERTAVRSSINSQVELLNYVRDHSADIDIWSTIKSEKAFTDTNSVGDSCTVHDNSFYITLENGNATLVSDANIGKNTSNKAIIGSGIWIDAVKVTDGSVPYLDFYVKACWTRLANNASASSTTTIRLYDSRHRE